MRRHSRPKSRTADGSRALIDFTEAQAGARPNCGRVVDICDRKSVACALRHALMHFGLTGQGLDVIISTTLFALVHSGRRARPNLRRRVGP